MKIVFICSSLESGKDGVGDYTRRLVGELIRQGHDASIIALHDRHIESIEEVIQTEQDTTISVLRLPACISWEKRVKGAKKYIERVEPEWLSLQYVPFGFHDKGLHWGLAERLLSIGQGRKWHIMFHELWVGIDIYSGIKLKIWGNIQRIFIIELLHKIKFRAIHTQSLCYKKLLLKDLEYEAYYLPLFSNIPLVDFGEDLNNNEKYIVIFGAIHSSSEAKILATEVAEYCLQNNTKVSLKIIGKSGVEKYSWIQAWRSVGLEAELLGEQPQEVISKVLWNATIGLSCTALAVIDKSGSVAAMRLHGLPVLCVAPHWFPRGIDKIEVPHGITEYQKGNFAGVFEIGKKNNNFTSLKDIALRFIKDIFLK